MSTLAIVRKELRLHRFASMTLCCCACLVLLGIATLWPRSWTVTAAIAIEADPAGPAPLAERLRDRVQDRAPPNAGLRTAFSGTELQLWYSASRAQDALDGVNTLLAHVVHEEIGDLRERMRQDERGIAVQFEEAQRRLAEAELKLGSAQRELPSGGESALGARIGQLQGESDALELDLRASAELKRKLGARIAQLDREIEEIRAAVAADTAAQREAAPATPAAPEPRLARIDGELLPLRRQTATRVATLNDEIALKERRRREIDALLEGARAQLSVMLEGNQALRELQRLYDDAAALHRQLRLRLQQVRDDIAMRATANALPFRIARQPTYPERPDGLPAWAMVAAAVLGGMLLACAPVLGRALLDDKLRLAEALVIDAELPVLAVIADYHPPQAAGHVRWPVIGNALLGIGTVASCLAFLLAFG